MAKIGLDNFLFGLLNESPDGTATYGEATKPGHAITCNVSISNNDVSLYGDNVKIESDTSFQSGTVTMGIDEDDLETQAVLLGHEITDGNLVRNSNDVAPYVGLGRIVTKMVNGQYRYKVEFLHKVKFGEPSQEDQTKGESVEFGTVEIEGTVSTLANGDWSIAQTFETRPEAVTYLESLFGTDTASSSASGGSTSGGSTSGGTSGGSTSGGTSGGSTSGGN